MYSRVGCALAGRAIGGARGSLDVFVGVPNARKPAAIFGDALSVFALGARGEVPPVGRAGRVRGRVHRRGLGGLGLAPQRRLPRNLVRRLQSELSEERGLLKSAAR